jgi:hypothetical protein
MDDEVFNENEGERTDAKTIPGPVFKYKPPNQAPINPPYAVYKSLQAKSSSKSVDVTLKETVDIKSILIVDKNKIGGDGAAGDIEIDGAESK